MRVIHVSDLHTHRDPEDNTELQKRITALASKVSPNDIVIVTGDITDDGAEAQYRNALVMLKQIQARILVVPGNHSQGFIGSVYDEECAKNFDVFAAKFNCGPFFHKAPFTVLVDNVLFMLLNSNIKSESVLDFACGKIGQAQMFHLDRILKIPAYRDMVKVVALHHHPIWMSDPTMRLLDAEKFIETVQGRVDIILNGHRHVHNIYRDTAGCKLIVAAGALYESNECDEITIDGDLISISTVRLLEENVV